MQLIYRGERYDYNPDKARSGNTGRPARLAHTTEPYTLIYRGLTLRVDPTAAPTPAQPATYDLLYRGTMLHVSRDAQGVTTAVAEPAQSAQRITVPASLPRHYIGKVHQANLLANLQRRLQTAQSQGNQSLIEQLEAERRQITA